MTEFYGLPNAGEFWHWTNALHFILVGLAGGVAFLAALLHLQNAKEARFFTLVALGLIALDLFVLWAESPARFRFTHVWLFLTFHPQSPIWWGAWGLALAFLSGGLLHLNRGPKEALKRVFLVASLVALAYPGLALAVNLNRPLWNALMLALFSPSPPWLWAWGWPSSSSRPGPGFPSRAFWAWPSSWPPSTPSA